MTTVPPSGGAHGSGLRPVPMDPRIRARRVAVKRAEGRRRLRVLSTMLATVLIAVLGLGVTRSPLLAVRHVQVQGSEHTPVAEVVAAAGLDGHRQMFDVHAGSLGRRLVAVLPWVASASVTRHWPSTVHVSVHERAAVAAVPAPNGVSALVDATGRVLASGPPGAATLGMPTVTGLDLAPQPGRWVGPAVAAEAALAVAVALPASLRQRLSTLSVAGQDEIKATLTTGTVVLLGAAGDLPAKFVALTTLLERVDQKGVTAIDVRVPSAPVLTHG